ncbi:hypothetical protein ACFQ1S_38175 [Kibdelosporangium lantanae]|uniref:Uncharacterized protein n=1 Tax=Kibdelosporangium lantanae TaxID=1497396 RepID=A0ABW3MJY1_9PSEU
MSIIRTENSACRNGPVLSSSMCMSWSTSTPPGGSAAKDAAAPGLKGALARYRVLTETL